MISTYFLFWNFLTSTPIGWSRRTGRPPWWMSCSRMQNSRSSRKGNMWKSSRRRTGIVERGRKGQKQPDIHNLKFYFFQKRKYVEIIKEKDRNSGKRKKR